MSFTNSVITYSVIIYIIIYLNRFILPDVISDLYDWCAYALLTIIIAWNLKSIVNKFLRRKTVPSENKSVLITGCDSGFGHELAKKLDSRGFQVFASCLFPDGDGANSLKKACSSSLHVLALDVMKEDSVKNALSYVKDNLKHTKLWAIVNNAGVMRLAPAELSTMEDIQMQININALGVVRVTKAFLPLIRRNKGRIITVTSIAGKIPLLFATGYCMGKFAAQSFCEILRQELYHFGVKVITVEPEFFQTALMDGGNFLFHFRNSSKDIDEEIKNDYGSKYIEELEINVKQILSTSSTKRYKVVDCLEEAICLENPSYVYKPRRNIVFQFIYVIFEFSPRSIADFIQRYYFILANYIFPNLPD